VLELPAIAQQGDDVLLVHRARKYQAPPRLEREQEQRRSGRSERSQAGGGAPARRPPRPRAARRWPAPSRRDRQIHSPSHSPGLGALALVRDCGQFGAVSKTVDGRKVVRGFESLPLRLKAVIERKRGVSPTPAGRLNACPLRTYFRQGSSPRSSEHGESVTRMGKQHPRLSRRRPKPCPRPGFLTEAVQTPARLNVTCVTPLGEEVASTS
jgi:hypothetical protein